MTPYLLFLFLGLSLGAVYASIALSITLTYQGSGVINFAAGAMATVPLYVFDDLRNGVFSLPLPGVPSVEVGEQPVWLAVLLGIVVAAVLGLLVELLISRPLRRAPVLAKVVAAVGVMLTIQAAVALKFGSDARSMTAVLPTGSVSVGGIQVPTDRLWFAGIVILAGAGLAIWLRRSRVGLAVQAAAENQRAAEFARLSPNVLGIVTWVVSSVFVALTMMLAGPAIGVLTPGNMTLLVVPALAAALIGRMSSLWAALAGGLGMGVLVAELQFLSQTKTWWPDWAKQGLTDAVPFLVIVVVLFVVGRSIPVRGDDEQLKLPAVRLPRNRPVVIAALVLGGVALVTLTDGSYRFGVINSLALSLIALSLVVLTGMVGQISLAQAGLAGAAGLVVSKLGTALPFPLPMIIGALVATVIGVLIGLPALRIRGAQLAVVTLAAAVVVQQFVLGNRLFVSTENSIPDPELFGLDLGVREGTTIARVPFGLLVLVVVAIAFVLVCNVMRSGTGRRMLAVRSNERAAASVGINVSGVKLTAFALASFLAGLGGSLIGYSRGVLSVESFGVLVGLSILAIAYIGGIASASGAFVAGAMGAVGIVFVILDRNLDLGPYYSVITGAGLILAVLFNPLGVAGGMRVEYDKLRARLRRKAGPDETPDAEPARTDPVLRRPTSRTIGEVCLRASDIRVTYGGVTAVDGVDIEVRAGEIVGLIGPNGAGKTSFIDAISGFTPATGTVELGGRDVSALPAYRRARLGLVRTWQSMELFDDLSVLGNVRVADDVRDRSFAFARDLFRPSRTPSGTVGDAMTLLSLTASGDGRPEELPLGRQKVLGVARALALEPQVLLLDEPAAGLDTPESIEFGNDLHQIAATGVGCLLVDHDMHLVFGVCDRVYVIEFGRPIAVGTPEEIRRNPQVLAAYLGGEHLEAVGADALAQEPTTIGGA
ncbi:ABC transporter [Pseudonocardia sulfidoxydans NBRC 16205]|uniref:ABC transporter n=1 Tax=Pseudonocardia sulfidoxydans NBRC 16205 TaxID=1223511 RepID=A0A511DAF1_9PSEU|nr:ATP-binding cassette domain-containing protein [Pseudonocardia sulfidoxydans]GEL21766.1 ABC transporter [Pseudonocardia sulfidoxydans NBRC 16205]